MKLKMIALAAAIVSLSGTANAALTSGSTVGNGSFSLVAFNTVTRDWYIRDLGYFINTFLPTGVTTLSGDGSATGDKTPSTGLLIDKSVNANWGDPLFATWFSQQAASDVRWMVGAYDQTSSNPASQRRIVVSSTNPSESFVNSNLDSFVSTANYGGLASFYNPTGATVGATGSGMTAPADTGFASQIQYATVGQSAGLFYAVRSAFTGSSPLSANTTQFGNEAGFATITLAANGDLTYFVPVSAVPLPGAVWLMGAGLMALGGVVRRRRAAAQA